MIRSVLSRPVRLVQHAALGAAHVGLNSVASVLSKVKPGSQDGAASSGTKDAGASSTKAAPPVDRDGDSRATPPPATRVPASAKKPEPAKKSTAKKSPATAAASVTPADVAARSAGPAGEEEHVEVEEVLAYSTGPDVTTTVGDEVSGSSTS